MSWGDVAWGSWWMMRYHLGLGSGLTDVFERAVMTLEGMEESLLDERTRIWFDKEIRDRIRVGAKTALERHRQAGDRLVLATSASVYEAKCASEAWGLEPGISTHFEVKEGCFTGRIASFAFGDFKCDRVVEWAEDQEVDLKTAYFYTDSTTDLALMDRVGRPVAVHPDRKLLALARRRGWPVQHWGRALRG